MTTPIFKLGLAAMLVAVAPAASVAQQRLTAEGTEFVLITADGRALRSAELVGATLRIGIKGREFEVTIRSVEDDPHAVGGRVVLHHFVVNDRSGRPVDLCAPDAAGQSRGFPVPDGRGGFELTCTSGAIGKCIRWGYRAWEERAGGPPLHALHQACVYMARADYGGDGSTATRDGTTVFVCARFGVRRCDVAAPLAFEAAWGAAGAVCVARPRIPEIVSLEQLGARYPRLKDRLGPACSEDAARRDPAALLFNRSAN
jgi:hypothetical protein